MLQQMVLLRQVFDFRRMQPLFETMIIFQESQNLMNYLREKELIDKTYARKDVSLSLIPLAGKEKSMGKVEKDREGITEETIYSLIYYDPETNKAESIPIDTKISVKDIAQKIIDESVGARNALSIYRFVASPIVYEIPDKEKIKRILDNMEYGTPPPFGSAAKVKYSLPKRKTKAPVLVVERKLAEYKPVLIKVAKRKLSLEKKIEKELKTYSLVIGMIKKGTPIRVAIKKLPKIPRKKFLTLLKRKKLKKEILLLLLLRDARFLKKVKKKLSSLSLKELLDLVKIFRLLALK